MTRRTGGSLLVVEDDESIAIPLVAALVRAGYAVAHESTLDDARRVVNSGAVIDLALLDVQLPDGSGIELCRWIKAQRPKLPIIIVTVSGDELDVIDGLDAGADDHVSKPFRVAELEARIRARLRRSAERPVTIGDLRIDPSSRRVWLGETELQLTVKEFDLLWLLARHVGELVGRDRIMREVWDEFWDGRSTKTLDMHVLTLRRKLGDDADAPKRIVTVRGGGVSLAPPTG